MESIHLNVLLWLSLLNMYRRDDYLLACQLTRSLLIKFIPVPSVTLRETQECKMELPWKQPWYSDGTY